MGKLDKIRQDNPELNVTIIDIIRAMDPSSTNKYCEFLIKMVKEEDNYQEIIVKSLIKGLFGESTIDTLHKFEGHSKANRIPSEYKDISRHNEWGTIIEAVKIADEIVKRKELEKDVNKIYEDGEWLVMIPQSYESSQLYANGTKWCITQKSYWNEYKKHSRIIYVINKKTDNKCAISKRMDTDVIQGWDAKDVETSPLMWEFTDEIWKIIRSELKKTKEEVILETLPEGMIIGSRGSIVSLGECTLREIENFYKKYGEFITPEFNEQVVERGKELRTNEQITDRADKLNTPSKKTILNNDIEDTFKRFFNNNQYYNYNNDYNFTLEELLNQYKI